MIDFSKCKTTKDYEQVLLASLRTYTIGKQVFSATGCPIDILAKYLRKYKHKYNDSFGSLETKSGHTENCLFPGDEIETECCGLCDHENEVPFRPGCYVSRCENCGEKMHLCSRCLYDDPEHGCDWNSETKTCWRG